MSKPRIKQNVWGNWYGYLGTKRVEMFLNTTTATQQQNAEAWLREQEWRNMKLKYRVWHLEAPTGSPSQAYSTLPLAMLASEGAFMKRDALYNALKQVEEGGKRIDQQWDFVYVQRPGFKSAVMNPNFERWESFGPGWGKFTRFDNLLPHVDYVKDPQDWVCILSLDTHGGLEVLTASLEDWINAKNSYAWQDFVFKKKQRKRQ